LLEVLARQAARTRRERALATGRWFSAHAVAIAALVVSITMPSIALWYATEAQRTDRYYREISIQPLLGLRTDTSNYSVLLENHGLGPAKIMRIATNFGQCVDSGQMTTVKEWDDSLMRLYRVLTEEIGKVFTEAVWRTNRMRPPDTQIGFPTLGAMILPARTSTVFAMVPDQIAPFNEAMEKVDPQLRYRTQVRFLEWARTAPVAIKYCSATQRYCSVLDTVGGFDKVEPCIP